MLRVLIVEDEPLARCRLRELLAAHSDAVVVGEVDNGADAIKQIDVLRPDVVFLDVELPNGNGIEVVRGIAHRPHVVFTTAFDNYAVAAFELAAVDYLMKPFGAARLAAALERVRAHGTDASPLAERAAGALENVGSAALSRFFVRDRGKLIPINVIDVERFEADDDYVRVVCKGRVHLVYLALNDFERRLDPERFVRIHRSHIVNMDFVKHLVSGDGGRMIVELQDGTRIVASRSRSRELRTLML
jgi:two-component system LytT family response regulator